MKKTEIVPLQTETKKNEQLSPISFDELSEILGGGKPTKGHNTQNGSCGGLILLVLNIKRIVPFFKRKHNLL